MKERIETIIDRLLDYVKLNGKISLDKAAPALGLSPAQTERLALLLEENGLIEVRYSLLGVTLYDKSLAAKRKADPALSKDPRVEGAQRMEEDVLKAESIMAFFEKNLEKRIAQAEALLDEMEKKSELSDAEIDFVRKEVDAALGQLAAFSQEIDQLGQKERHFYQRLESFRQKINRMQAHQEIRRPAPVWERFWRWVYRLAHPPAGKRPRLSRRAGRPRPPVIIFGPQPIRVRKLVRRKDRVREHYWFRRKGGTP